MQWLLIFKQRLPVAVTPSHFQALAFLELNHIKDLTLITFPSLFFYFYGTERSLPLSGSYSALF